MVSTTNITLTADTELDTRLALRTNERPDEQVVVQVGVPGHALALWAADPDDLERLAATCITAANEMRAVREAAA